MKKSKRSFELEDQESGPSGKIGIELDKHEDEEIIDLDDIVELGGQPEEEDELDLGVELIDLEADMDFKDIGAGGGPDDDALEESLLKGLPMGRDFRGKKGARKTALSDGDEHADLMKGFSFDAGESQARGAVEEMDFVDETKADDPLEGLVFAAEEKPKGDAIQKSAALKKDAAQEERKAPAEARRDALADDGLLDESLIQIPGTRAVPAGIGVMDAREPSLDGVVDEIESRLCEMVREMVEARLPDIVRAVLQEEILKLKAEMKH